MVRFVLFGRTGAAGIVLLPLRLRQGVCGCCSGRCPRRVAGVLGRCASGPGRDAARGGRACCQAAGLRRGGAAARAACAAFCTISDIAIFPGYIHSLSGCEPLRGKGCGPRGLRRILHYFRYSHFPGIYPFAFGLRASAGKGLRSDRVPKHTDQGPMRPDRAPKCSDRTPKYPDRAPRRTSR